MSLSTFIHKSQQLGSAHSIFSKAPGGAAAISSAKLPSLKSSSQRTPRWRERDSNFRKEPLSLSLFGGFEVSRLCLCDSLPARSVRSQFRRDRGCYTEGAPLR